MKIITGFEDKPFVEDPGPGNKGFVDVFKALSLNHEAAENAFTRVAKKAFRKYTKGGKFIEARNARELRPTWVAESSVVFSIDDPDENAYRAMAEDLQRLVTSLVRAFQVTAEIPHVALIEPLKCRIQMVGKQDCKFTLKQVWALT